MTYYLANVLAPLWGSQEASGAVLKRRNTSPFFPEFQQAIDRLIGRGLIAVTDTRHIMNDDGRRRVSADYSINKESSIRALQAIIDNSSTYALAYHVKELLLALSSYSDDQLDASHSEDATYSDMHIGPDNVVDYGEWLKRNPSTNAAAAIANSRPSSIKADPSEKLHLYVMHLRERLTNVG